MGLLYNCGVCCMILSTWAVLQLIVMGILMKVEAIAFLDDVIAETYTDFDDFIKQTQDNYDLVAINCWIAAAIYAVMILLSYFCIVKARRNARIKAQKLEDDDLFCKDKAKVI